VVSAIVNGRRLNDQMTIKPLALRRTPFGWDYEDSVTPEMRTSFNLYSMYLTGGFSLAAGGKVEFVLGQFTSALCDGFVRSVVGLAHDLLHR